MAAKVMLDDAAWRATMMGYAAIAAQRVTVANSKVLSTRLSELMGRLVEDHEAKLARIEYLENLLAPHVARSVVVHGVSCTKKIHVGGGFLHDVLDDSPFTDDGVRYCGRCHEAL